MKINKRIISAVLLVSIVATITACKEKNNDLNNNDDLVKTNSLSVLIPKNTIDASNQESIVVVTENPMVDEIITEEVTEAVTEELVNEEVSNIPNEELVTNVETKDLKTLLNAYLYNEGIDYNAVINSYLNSEGETRSHIMNDYYVAIYMSLYNSNVPLEEYLKELHMMVVLAQVPMGLPENIWNQLFHNLINLSYGCQSLFDKYLDFAKYVHDIECDYNHYYNELDCFTCEELQTEYKKVRQ